MSQSPYLKPTTLNIFLEQTAISLIVWLGLRSSRRTADKRFPFGYFKLESFAALVAAYGMVVVASVPLYYSYMRLLEPK